MSNTGVQVFMGGAVRPANVAAAFDGDANIQEKISIPSLSIAGKKFSMKIEGETTILTRPDLDTGEKVNLPFINVVVVAMNPNRSRTYFAKAYVSGENQAPACYSSDGAKPDKDVKAPCAATCASCPNSVKGSRIKDGKEGYACSSIRRLAIWPAAMLSNDTLKLPVMQLILPMTSIWDKENKQNDAEMWFAWDNYVDDLRARGVKHTGEVITRIKFDNSEYPKLLFKAVRWLDDAEHSQFNELAKVKSVIGTDDVKKLLYGRMYDEDTAETAVPVAAPVSIKSVVNPDDDGFSAAVPVAKSAVKPVAAAAAATPAAKRTPKAKPAPAPASAAPAPVASAAPNDDLDKLAAEWDA
jgi:hypothetical protein